MYCQCNHTRMENIFLISISGEGELLNLLAGLKPQLRSVQALHPFQLRASRNNAAFGAFGHQPILCFDFLALVWRFLLTIDHKSDTSCFLFLHSFQPSG